MLQFKRITTQKRFIPQIDGLRFVAIASVVFFHIYAALEIGAIPVPIPFNTDLAKRGVELFFAISGFILEMCIRDRPDTRLGHLQEASSFPSRRLQTF